MPKMRRLQAPVLKRVSRTVEIVGTAFSALQASKVAEPSTSPTPAQVKTITRFRMKARAQLLRAAEELRKAAAAIPE